MKVNLALTPTEAVELTALLEQLYWHHVSQAKTNALQCSPGYHLTLAKRLAKLTKLPAPKSR